MDHYSVVFAGLSVTQDEVLNISSNIEVLPPIKRGDIDKLLTREVLPAAIGIIDGQFMQVLTVSPKEIVTAMNWGLKFYGSSSMGALRAAELHRYGMIGIGKIFDLYAEDEIDADDEVALVYNPSTLEVACEPMVNLRLAGKELTKNGSISQKELSTILTEYKSIYFPDRSYEELFARIRTKCSLSETRCEELYDLFSKSSDSKHEDAIKLVEEINRYTANLILSKRRA